jgi:hypothetical protein
LVPCSAPAGNPDFVAFSGKLDVLAGILYTTQCTYTIFGFAGSGASGSSTINAKLLVPAGASDHSSGGERSSPSQVYRDGIFPFGANADDVSLNAMVSVADEVDGRV